jgi:hypothetical protein
MQEESFEMHEASTTSAPIKPHARVLFFIERASYQTDSDWKPSDRRAAQPEEVPHFLRILAE